VSLRTISQPHEAGRKDDQVKLNTKTLGLHEAKPALRGSPTRRARAAGVRQTGCVHARGPPHSTPPFTKCPSSMYARCVTQSASPSKMWVAYTMVVPRSSHSWRKKARSCSRPTTSRSTVISSSSSTCVRACGRSGRRGERSS